MHNVRSNKLQSYIALCWGFIAHAVQSFVYTSQMGAARINRAKPPTPADWGEVGL